MFGKTRVPAPFVAPKVLVINFAPMFPEQGGKRLHEVLGWNNPYTLMPQYIADIEECSYGYVRYRIVETIDVDAYPLKLDGFRYTNTTYMACHEGKEVWHQSDAVDYAAIFRAYKIPWRVMLGDVDEVWLWGFPYGGFWESTMAGGRPYFCNSEPVPGFWGLRTFVTMGFNYERGVGEMLEAFGHRIESILRHVYGSWEHAPTHAWNRFTLYDKVAPGEAACGNIHFAPNSERDYDWGNHRTVMSNADDWLDYPDLTGAKKPMNCAQWGNGDIREHHRWWLNRLPHAEGRAADGKLNNWWPYIVDFNRFQESRR